MATTPNFSPHFGHGDSFGLRPVPGRGPRMIPALRFSCHFGHTLKATKSASLQSGVHPTAELHTPLVSLLAPRPAVHRHPPSHAAFFLLLTNGTFLRQSVLDW